MYLQTLDILRHKIYLVLFPVKVYVYYRKNKKKEPGVILMPDVNGDCKA